MIDVPSKPAVESYGPSDPNAFDLLHIPLRGVDGLGETFRFPVELDVLNAVRPSNRGVVTARFEERVDCRFGLQVSALDDQGEVMDRHLGHSRRLRVCWSHAKNLRIVPFENPVFGSPRQARDPGLGHEDEDRARLYGEGKVTLARAGRDAGVSLPLLGLDEATVFGGGGEGPQRADDVLVVPILLLSSREWSRECETNPRSSAGCTSLFSFC